MSASARWSRMCASMASALGVDEDREGGLRFMPLPLHVPCRALTEQPDTEIRDFRMPERKVSSPTGRVVTLGGRAEGTSRLDRAHRPQSGRR